MTHSIAAVDRSSGLIGVATATCMPAVGASVPWARAGVGAVATQATVDPRYGAAGLDLLAAGEAPSAVLARLRSDDPAAEHRQVAVIDAAGRTAGFTGADCFGRCGHLSGDGYIVAGNMVATDDVWPAMAREFEASTAPLPERLVAALQAGEQAGGDARGQQSAALLVVEGTRRGDPWDGVVMDLRVDGDDEGRPLPRLVELVTLQRAYEPFHEAAAALMAGDAASALEASGRAVAARPQDCSIGFIRAGALFTAGRVDEALVLMTELLARRPALQALFDSAIARSTAPPGATADPRGGSGETVQS
jgi:uncharacterized Ntn-hydrolase superfamily protein